MDNLWKEISPYVACYGIFLGIAYIFYLFSGETGFIDYLWASAAQIGEWISK